MLGRARRLDERKSGEGYWSRVVERAARAFENYVMKRMLDQGYVNDFLANVLPASEIDKNDARYPYSLLLRRLLMICWERSRPARMRRGMWSCSARHRRTGRP
jgi:hypothetical protein